MKKFAVCVALDVMTTGAIAKACKTARIGVDASSPPFESAAVTGRIHGRNVGIKADRTQTGTQVT
jgi:histidine transport system substrate-binding protein